MRKRIVDARWRSGLAMFAAVAIVHACRDKGAQDASAAGAATAGDEAPDVGAAGDGSPAGESGSGGSDTGTGETSAGGTGAGAGTAGDGGATATCDPACPAGQRCELVQVQCVRAPCPPQPQCVDASTSAGGASCGSRGLPPCPDGQYCDWPASANCGDTDAPGTCKPRPEMCTREYRPVCGCDGQTYGNPCEAAAAGASVRRQGECDAAGTGAALRDCDPRKVLCKRMPPECPEGQVATVSGSCYGECTPVEQCACSGPEQCPNSDTFTCHLSAGHCGPYVGL